MSKYDGAGDEVENIIKNIDSYAKKEGRDTWVFRADQALKQRKIKSDIGKQDFVREVRKDIFQATQLTSSAGIGCNELISSFAAKLK